MPNTARAMTPLPQPDGIPGAPFADPNLKLVVIDELISAGIIDLGSPGEFLSQMLGRTYEPRSDGQQPRKCQPAYDYLVRYPLTPQQLQSVDSLCFDGGNDIYEFIWPGWDGETSDFNISSLDGIECLTELQTFNEISMLQVVDFKPLCALPKLTTLDLGLGTTASVDVLLGLPALRTFKCYEDDAPDDATLAQLAARGVGVRLY